MVKWDLEDIYHFKETDKLILELNKRVEGFKKFRIKLNDSLSLEDFLKIIKCKEEIDVLAHKLVSYAALSLSENTSDPKRIAYDSRISNLCTKIANEVLFFNLWFKGLSDKKADYYITNSGVYAYFLTVSRKYKPFTLNEGEERIINLKDVSGVDALISIYEIMTNGFVFEWRGKKLSKDELFSKVHSRVRSDRKDAYDLILTKFGKEELILSEIYKGIVTDYKNENLTIRKFSSQISVRNFDNEIPDKAVSALLNALRNNVYLFQEYFKLKAKICKVTLDRYDLYVDYKTSSKHYSFGVCKDLVLDVLKEFSEVMYTNANKVFNEGHVHSDITKNKRSGAFCAHVSKDTTPYVFLNHFNKLEDAYALMHETSHAIHSILASSNKENSEFTVTSSLPLAETASVFGELLLSKSLLKKAGVEQKKAILIKQLDGFYATIIRQGYFTLFEIKAHEAFNNNATTEEINQIYLDNLKEQFGKAVKVPSVFKHEWKYIPHIYFSPFYCYSYSFGNLLVLSLYKRYLDEGESFVPKFLKILSYGGSKPPADILKEVGIDITKESFWQEGFEIIKEEIDELRKIS